MPAHDARAYTHTRRALGVVVSASANAGCAWPNDGNVLHATEQFNLCTAQSRDVYVRRQMQMAASACEGADLGSSDGARKGADAVDLRGSDPKAVLLLAAKAIASTKYQMALMS